MAPTDRDVEPSLAGDEGYGTCFLRYITAAGVGRPMVGDRPIRVGRERPLCGNLFFREWWQNTARIMQTRRDDCVPLDLPARAPVMATLLQWRKQRQPFIDPMGSGHRWRCD